MSREDRSIVGWGAFAVAIAALCVALFGLRDTAASDTSSASGGGDATVIDIDLAEWSVSGVPADIAEGALTINVTNTGNMVHNLSIPSLSAKTPDLQPGESYELDLGTVPAGSYDMLCDIAGHAASGMTATMAVGGGGGDSTAGTPDMPDMDGMSGVDADGTMDWQTMDRAMDDRNLQFPAQTEGKGGGILEPTTVEADGTKVYDVVAEIVPWEVEPGKIVDAWTYNGTVPAPEIHLQVGDKFRMNFTNNLTESTAVHFHGVRVPYQMDGVPPYTQHQVRPGESMVYEFEAIEPAVGIYHSHHNAQLQVPNGLFGGFFIGEMEIPEYLQEKGFTEIDKEVTMVLNDSGTIGLSLNGKSFPATEPYTLRVGETMLVHYMNEGLMAHPMHMHQPTGWVIAKDGKQLDFPMPGDTINVAPGERYSVLYQAQDIGVWAWHCHILNHAEGPDGMFGMVTALIVTE